MEPSGHSFARGTREVTLRRPSAAVTTYLLPLFFLFTTPLWAIPSPDLVVNFVASAAQVLGVLTLFLGGFAISSRKGVKSSGPASKGLRWSFRIAVTLLLVSLGANVFQYFSRIDATNCRLQTNLWRSSQEAGKKVGDVNLKTLSYSDQLKHPQAFNTEDLVHWIQQGRPMNLIDVREPEEVEMGYVQGAWHRRYPDLQKNRAGLIQEGKETILLCESGNRSSELVNEFLKEGIKCRFMIGGYEKWVAEGRPLVDAKEHASGQIRDIPDYRNKYVLLDTPDVTGLLEKEKILFVDVRYPGDFDLGHLPNAVDLPMRMLTSEELWPALKNLPHQPIVAPCYDKRSSFYGLLLGLRLSRLGYDFRGRYTVPHEFAVPVEEKAYLAQWRETQAGKTLLGMASRPIDGALEWLKARAGHIVLAVFLLVMILRLLVLPFTVKSDRDQIVQRRIAPEIKGLKERLGADRQRLSRAILKLHRRERLTPAWNCAGMLFLILLFTLCFSVVGRAASKASEEFLWIKALGSPDPLYLLPAAVGGLITFYLLVNRSKKTRGSLLLPFICGPLLFLLTFQLGALVNLYLVFNLGLLLVQSRLVRSAILARDPSRKTGQSRSRSLEDSGIVLLKMALLVPGTGNKAIRLGQMMEAGLPVPDGFVLTDKILSREGQKLSLTGEERGILSRAWKKTRATQVAVRSSGLNEDGAQKSYAGVFESILNVTWDNLLSAIEEVHSSLRSARVAAYSGKEDERGGILVQKMVPAEYAGVLFTEHPASTGCMLAEVVPGLGDALVSGNATPKSYRFGRLTSTPLDSEKPPIDLAPLLTLGRKVEEIFGRPQDIEWAYSHGHFHILQARDITTSARDGSGPKALLERERDRLLSLAALGLAREAEARGQKGPETRATALFAQNELSELMPRPTPLSLSFMERLWSGGGSTDLACRALRVPYDVDEDAPPYANSVFGALYINRMEERRRLSRGPGALASFRLARAPAALEREFREEFLPRFLEEVRFREALEPSRLLLPELLSLFKEWTQRFVTETYVYAEKINLAADFYLKVAKKELEKRGLDPAAFLGHLPPTVVHQAMSLLPKIRSGEREVGEFLAIFGHRAPEDYELAQPRYREDPRLVAELASLAEVHVPDSRDGLLPPEGSDDKLLKVTMERARHFQVLKEEAKHHALRELATLRTLLVEIDARLELDDGIFYLTVDEVAMLGDQFCNQAIDLIDRRRSIAEEWKAVELPTELTIVQLEGMNTEAITTGCAVVVSAGEKSGILRGTRVSGDKEVVGRVRVIHHPKEIHSFQAGEVLVARFTDPTWTPLFPMASGVITEVGGWLSHAAIVAREYNISGIVGVNGAMNSLKTGQMVRLCSNGTIEPIEPDRRRHHRVPLLARVALSKQGETIDAILRNLSRTGALIEVGEELETGQGIHLRISSDTEEVRAEVVRKDASGRYGVHFTTPFGGPFPPYDPQEGPVKN